MRSVFFKSAVIFTFFFAVGFFFTQRLMNQGADGFDFSSRAPSAVPERVWAVSAYLPDQPNQKVYLTLQGKQIKDISTTKPAVDYVLETETIVFPGLMDMHNHTKYNVLPLWRGGQSQYVNRYEWRGYNAYKDEVTGMMHGFDKLGVCAAFRWGELRALVGGTTSMQGGNDKCSAGFGPMNIEAKDELTPNVIRAATDPLSGPDFMGNVFVPMIAPAIQKSQAQLESLPVGDRQEATNRLYDTTLMNILNTSGITAWLETYANQPRSLRLGVKLLIGEDFPALTDNSQAAFDALVPEIQKVLVSPKYAMTGTAPDKQIAAMRLWLYGTGDGKSGYLNSKQSATPLQGAALLDDSGTMEYFQKAGVISLDKKIRRYLAKFEIASRRSLLKYFASPTKQAVVAHLSEGQRNDPYNKLEYQFAAQMGFLQPGFVIIHGVGLDAKMLADAARRGVSIVWSPTSNLLLYGETLDVVAAKKAGITVALGSDWGPSGTKSMLDEIKIARQYLNKIRVPTNVISDKDIVDMATTNAAKALNLQNSVGQVKKGYLANLLFVNKKVLEKQPNAYSALIAATENDVDLVVVGGEPVYGEQKNIEDVARGFKDASVPESINKCNLQKAMRFPFTSKADTEMLAQNVNLRSVANIETLLKNQFQAFKVKLQTSTPRLAALVPNLDPMYPCEDQAYQNYMKTFISTTLDQNNAQRAQLRATYRLKPGFNPMTAAPATEDDDGNNDQ